MGVPPRNLRNMHHQFEAFFSPYLAVKLPGDGAEGLLGGLHLREIDSKNHVDSFDKRIFFQDILQAAMRHFSYITSLYIYIYICIYTYMRYMYILYLHLSVCNALLLFEHEPNFRGLLWPIAFPKSSAILSRKPRSQTLPKSSRYSSLISPSTVDISNGRLSSFRILWESWIHGPRKSPIKLWSPWLSWLILKQFSIANR